MQATTKNTALIRGNRNFYNVDQFNNPLYPKVETVDANSHDLVSDNATKKQLSM